MSFLKNQKFIVYFFPAAVFFIHIYSNLFANYGIFRDELYYVACANHPAWGYVDQPPFSIFILMIVNFLIGNSLFALRLLPAILSAATVFVTTLMVKRMQGGTTAVFIASACTALAPVILAMNTFYSMNSIDIFLWALAFYFTIKIYQEDKFYDWIILGVIFGLGMLNKISMSWYCISFTVALALTPYRVKFLKKEFWFLVVIAGVIFSPFIFWNFANNMAHLEFMRNATLHKYSGLSRTDFIIGQIFNLNPSALPIWLFGLYFFFFNKEGKNFKYLGIIYGITFLILFINGKSKPEYLTVAYTALFAGGGLMLEKLKTTKLKSAIVNVWVVIVIFAGIISIPMAMPVLPVPEFLRYQKALGQEPGSPEGKKLTGLSQFYADMHGWENMAATVSKVYKSLPSDVQKTTVVYGNNYGEAGAIDYFSKKYPLPPAISYHNNYWIWAFGSKPFNTVIIIGGEKSDHLRVFEDVEEAAKIISPYAMPYENNLPVFICHNIKVNLYDIWKCEKTFI